MGGDAIVNPATAAADAVSDTTGLVTPSDSPLHQASWIGDLSAVRACLRDGADVVRDTITASADLSPAAAQSTGSVG